MLVRMRSRDKISGICKGPPKKPPVATIAEFEFEIDMIRYHCSPHCPDMYEEDEEARQAARILSMRHLYHIVSLCLSIILGACTSLLQIQSAHCTREPYHTSILTGEGWVIELLTVHPKHIRCELGVSSEVFILLINELRGMGYNNLKYTSLEEQLAIFLYMSVTGLTIRHVGERFQQSNEMISRYAHHSLLL